MTQQHRLTIIISKSLAADVKSKAAYADTSVSDVVRGLLRLWVADRVVVPPDIAQLELPLQEGSEDEMP